MPFQIPKGRESPFSTGSELLDSILGIGEFDPLSLVGGPLAFGPIRTRDQKKAISALWRASPDILKRILEDVRTLNIRVPRLQKPKSMPSGTSRPGVDPALDSLLSKSQGVYNPARQEIAINPLEMKGLDPVGEATYGAGLPSTMLHEGLHFLNEPKLWRMAQQSPEDATTIGALLKEFLPSGGREHVSSKLSQYSSARPAGPAYTAAPAYSAASEGIAWLGEQALAQRRSRVENQMAQTLFDLLMKMK